MSSRMAFQVGDRFGKLVVPCCKICNRAKNNMDQREFIEWARKVTNYTVGLPMAEQCGGDIKEDA